MILIILSVSVVAIYILGILNHPSMPKPKYEGVYQFKNVNIVQPNKTIQKKHLTIRGNKIDDISTIETAFSNSEFEDYYILPGLIDAHVHLPPGNVLRLPEYFSLLFLFNGITGIRDTGDGDGTSLPYYKEKIKKEKIYGPRLASCGGYVIGGNPKFKNYHLVTNEEEAKKAVLKIKKEGNEFIKAYDYLNKESIRYLIKYAHQNGLKVIGHVPFGLSYENCGVPEIQHFHGVPLPSDLRRDHNISRTADWQNVDEKRMDFIVKYTKSNKILNTPTISSTLAFLKFYNYCDNKNDEDFLMMPRLYRDVVWHPDFFPIFKGAQPDDKEFLKASMAKKERLLKKLFDAGMRIFIGTDTSQPFSVPGYATINEFKVFLSSGIPLKDTWEIATERAGNYIFNKETGILKKSKYADLLLFEKDPTENFDNFSSLKAIVVNGKLFYKTDIEKSIKKFQKYHSNPLYDFFSVFLGKRKLKKMTKN